MTNDVRWCSRCNASPCQLRPEEMGRGYREKARRLAAERGRLIRDWQLRNERRLAATSKPLAGRLLEMAQAEAQRIVAAKEQGLIHLDPAAIDHAKRELVTQIRRQRHGALHDTKSNEEWTAQCTAIAIELGIDWAELRAIRPKEAA